jgi:4-amino-4-deoxy-L-arabinose transferase-like glycosyltransferase
MSANDWWAIGIVALAYVLLALDLVYWLGYRIPRRLTRVEACLTRIERGLEEGTP